MDKIKFAKVKENAVIPSKREEDAGFDIYACFNEPYMIISPNETMMIPTGIASAFDSDYVIMLKERGSSGSKGIGQRCGIIDSGFRDEWKCVVTNHTNKNIIITDLTVGELLELSEKNKSDDILDYVLEGKLLIRCDLTTGDTYELFTIYPKSKAICQALLLPVPKIEIEEITYDELIKIESERGNGMLGSSGK